MRCYEAALHSEACFCRVGALAPHFAREIPQLVNVRKGLSQAFTLVSRFINMGGTRHAALSFIDPSRHYTAFSHSTFRYCTLESNDDKFEFD